MDTDETQVNEKSQQLITCPKSFVEAIQRLCKGKDAIAFRNPSGLRIMLRYDLTSELISDSEENKNVLSFDLSILLEGESDYIKKLIQNEVDMMMDSGEVENCVIDEFDLNPTNESDVQEVIDLINKVYTWSICPCGEYLIKDNDTMCLYCQMIQPPDDELENFFCPICHEETRVRWSVQLPCCKQKIHRSCKIRYEEKQRQQQQQDEDTSQDLHCPLCRSVYHL